MQSARALDAEVVVIAKQEEEKVEGLGTFELDLIAGGAVICNDH